MHSNSHGLVNLAQRANQSRVCCKTVLEIEELTSLSLSLSLSLSVSLCLSLFIVIAHSSSISASGRLAESKINSTSYERYSPLFQSPLLPPLFSTTLISPRLISSPATALHMSQTVNPATETPIKASISTPVVPRHFAVQVISIDESTWEGTRVTEMCESDRG